MKKIEINSLTLITDDNNNVIGGYGFCDDESAKPVIDKLIAGVVGKATAPKSPTCCPCCYEEEEEDSYEDYDWEPFDVMGEDSMRFM